jgi:hypothetical protein
MRNKSICAAGGAVALGLFGALPAAVATSPPATAQAVVMTESYTIGNGSVTGATAVPQPDTAGATANYTVGFTTPSALASGSATVTLASADGALTFPATANSYVVVDNSNPSSVATVSKVVLGTGNHSVTLTLPLSVAASSSVSIYVIGVTNPTAAGGYSLDVSTSANTVPASTAVFQVVGASAAPSFAPTASPALVGGTSTYTIGAFKAAAAIPAGGTIVVDSQGSTGVSDNVGFPTAAAYYKVTDLTTGASFAPEAVTVAPVAGGNTGQQVTLQVGTAIAAGDELSVTVNGVRNPTSSQVDVVTAAAPAGSTASSASLQIGTSVANPTVGLSQSGAGATGVEYTVGFKPATSLPAGGTITLVAPPGTSFASSTVTVVDSTHVASSAAITSSSVHVSSTAGSSTANQLSFSVPNAITAGDSVFIEVAGVTNPPAGTYGGSAGNFTISTSADAVAAPVASYTVTGGSSSALASIEVSPSTPQASATYTIGDLRATAALAGGSATIQLGAPQGTVLPGAPVDYTVVDQSAHASVHPQSVSGGGSSTATFVLGSSIASGDYIEVVVDGVVNPGPGTYQVNLTGDLQAAVAPTTPTVPPAPAPARATTTSLSASVNPVGIGQAVTYTARVSPAPNSGSVVFNQGGAPIASCTSQPVHAGQATCTVTYWAAGRHSVQASYSGASGWKSSTSAPLAEAVSLPPTGYWLLGRTGAVCGLEGAPNMGSFTPSSSSASVVDMAGTPSGKGYWVVTSNGTVQAFGNAKFYGDLPRINVHAKDIVAIAPTYNGQGYWLIGKDGGMFTFGNARFFGSIPGLHIHVHDIVGMVANSGGGGYLLVGDDGGVFTFGKARFFGSLPGIHRHVHDIQAILPASAGTGYVLVGADGGVFNFGKGVRFYGSLPGEGVHVRDVVGIALTPDDGGYFMAGSNGNVYGFGNAHPASMPSGLSSNLPVVAIAGT